MPANAISAEQAFALMRQIDQRPIIAPIPYTSSIDRVAHPEQLDIDNWQEAVADRDILPSVPTLIVCRAAAALACTASERQPSFTVVGEHTFGLQHTSTTQLMERAITAELRAMHPEKQAVFSPEKPSGANTTTNQIAWLAGQMAQQPEPGRALLIALGRDHMRRLRLLADLYNLPADIVDAHDILTATRQTDTAIGKAVQLFETNNARYEQRALRVTRVMSRLGRHATSWIFTRLSRRSGPNVVDIEGSDNNLSFIQMPAPQMVRHQAMRQRQQSTEVLPVSG